MMCVGVIGGVIWCTSDGKQLLVNYRQKETQLNFIGVYERKFGYANLRCCPFQIRKSHQVPLCYERRPLK
jgi:hypothetical protein